MTKISVHFVLLVMALTSVMVLSACGKRPAYLERPSAEAQNQ